MKTKYKIVILAGVFIGIVTIIVPTILFLTHPPITNNHNTLANVIYPNPLFNRGVVSDFVLENDDKIYFLVGNYNASYGSSPIMISLDFQTQTSTYVEMFPNQLLMMMHQLRIGIDPNNELIAYRFYTNSFFYPVGGLYKTNSSGDWIVYPTLANKNNPYSGFYFRSVYNWNFLPS